MSWKDSSTCMHGDLTGDVFPGTMGTINAREGRGRRSPSYKPYRYVSPQRVGFCTVLV